MSESLTDMVSQESIEKGDIKIENVDYYTVPHAARLAGVNRTTMLNWCRAREVKSRIPGVSDIMLNVYQDFASGHYYLRQDSLRMLMPKNRLISK